jgi:hypothetical protein
VPIPDFTPSVLGTSILAFTVACEFAVVVALAAAMTYDRNRLGTELALWYFAACALLLYYFGPHMHERYIVYPLIFVVLWAFAARRPAALWAAAFLSVAAALQFAIGFNGPKPLLFEQLPVRYACYLAYCALNAAGVVALLFSRVADHVPLTRSAAADPVT